MLLFLHSLKFTKRHSLVFVYLNVANIMFHSHTQMKLDNCFPIDKELKQEITDISTKKQLLSANLRTVQENLYASD
jgi:hypothetical protein